MTFGMQVRSWWREASRSQVGSTVAVSAVAVLLVAVSVHPGNTGDGEAVAAGFGGTQVGSDAVVGGGGDAGGVTGTTAAAEAGAGGAAVANAAGTAARATTTGSHAGSGPGSTGSGGAGTGTGGGAGGGAGSSSVKRTASDDGITADAMKVGVAIINLGPFKEAGGAVGLREDGEAVVKALEDDINERGGIAGRRLVTSPRRVDILSETDQNAACKEFLDDRKVFAVVDSANFNTESAQRCITQDHQAPFVHTFALTEDLQNGPRGLDVTAPRNANRIGREWITAAIDQGFIKGGEVVGVTGFDCDKVIDQDVIPLIERTHPAKIVVKRTRCLSLPDTSTVTSDVLSMYSEGVTHVFPGAGAAYLQLFTKQAETQRPPGRERFKYFVSEYGATIDPNNETSYDPNQFEGVRGTQGVVAFHPPPGTPKPAGVKRCSDILERHGLPGVELNAGNTEVLALCDHFLMFEKIMALTGPNPTRPLFAAAVPQVGSFELGESPMASLGRNKFSAADSVVDVQWSRECTCFKQVSGYRRGKF